MDYFRITSTEDVRYIKSTKTHTLFSCVRTRLQGYGEENYGHRMSIILVKGDSHHLLSVDKGVAHNKIQKFG